MKRKGFAIVYVLILVIPVAFMALSLMDINLVNYKMSNNIVNAQQSYYYAEAGLEHGSYKIKQLGYPTNYKATYYLFFDDLMINTTLNYSGDRYVFISLNCVQSLGKTICTIDSTGFFKGSMRNIKRELNF